MKRWNISLATVLLLVSPLVACGDDDSGTTTTSDTGNLFDTSSTDFPDADTATPPPDTNRPPTDTTTPADTAAPDLIPDITGPSVAMTTPADGASNVALPLNITIVFSEEVYAPTIAAQTVKLIDFEGNEIPSTVTLAADMKTVSLVPQEANQQLASPYTIRVVGNIITDLQGNKLVNTFEATFTTANFPNQDNYLTLAGKYAPKIISTVDQGQLPHAQVPTKLDPDGDFDLDNNRDWLIQTATSLIPAVYFWVSETRTHYFINYALYFPFINHSQQSFQHANGTIGAIVTVEKARGGNPERPLSLHLIFKENTSEENYAFATDESGLVKAGDDPSDWRYATTFPQTTLFEGDRFVWHVSARDHQSCLWGWDAGFLPACEFNSAVENGEKLVFAFKGGAPTPFVKAMAGWPTDMSKIDGAPADLGYALIPVLSSLWPRRWATGAGAIWEIDTFTYAADGLRPAGGLKLTNKLRDPLGVNFSAFGRAPWAWGFNPSVTSGGNGGFAGITQGQLSIDPAWYMSERHGPAPGNSIIDYNEADGSGFSVDYCFNGFANIDNRTTDPACN